MTNALDTFRPISRGYWANGNLRISIDGCKTAVAYEIGADGYAIHIRNANNKNKRFRSAEAAAKALLNNRA